MAEAATETVIAIYRVARGNEAEFREILRGHHPTLLRLGLATAEPPVIYQGSEDGAEGGPLFFEIFSWTDGEAVKKAHHDPEVGKIWGRIGELCEARGGKPPFLFPHVERIDPLA